MQNNNNSANTKEKTDVKATIAVQIQRNNYTLDDKK